MFITRLPSLPRVAAAIVTGLLILSCALAGSARAADNDYCATGSTTTYDGPANGTWGTDTSTTNWSGGLPDLNCDAVIPAGDTVTLTTTPAPGNEGTFNGGSAEGLTIDSGATVIVEGVSSQGLYGGQTGNSTPLTIGGNGLTVDQGATLDIEATGNASPFTGNPSGQTPGGSASVDVDSGNGGNGSSPAPVANDGTITASSSDAAFGEAFDVGGTVTNAGTFSDQSGALTLQGQQNLPYVFDNTGSFAIASGASLTMLAGDGSSFTNNGTFANQGTAALEQSMYWIQSGGSETGNPVQLSGPETLQDSVGAGSFEVTNCTVANLTGTIPANQTITVLGGCFGTTLNLGTSKDTATVVNDGTLVLSAPANGSDGILQGSELDNRGTLDSTVGGGLPLANQLLVPLVNESGATVNLSGGELAQTTGSATSNAGTVNIGPGATWLVQAGSFTNSGTLAPEIAGATNAGTVNLTVGSKLNAGGVLAPELVSGYAPATGSEFPVVTLNGGSVNGTFGSVTGGFSADYTKETASTPYVGVVYGGSGGSAAGTAAPTAGRAKGGAGKVTLKVSCPATASSCSSYAASGTVTEHLKGKKVVAVAASARQGKAKTKVVTVGSKSGSLAPGKSATVTIKLNATGAALLKRFHRLRVLVALSSGGKVVAKTTVTVTEPKTKRKKK